MWLLQQKSYVQDRSLLYSVDALSTLSTNKRLKTALGGFVAFTGFIVLIIVIMSSTDSVDIKSVFQNKVLIGAAAFLGVLDIFCGLLLFFREKNFKLFTPKKKKTSDNIQ